MARSTPDPPFASLVPVRQHRWEDHADGLVTVLVPRFTGRLTRRWLMPLLARPHVRLRLDQMGSFVWLACDGRTDIAAVARALASRFGVGQADALSRVTSFVRKLARTTSLTFLAPTGADSP
ncbi:MAG TPA: PqqD family protein [Gemmatimonadales bacterium]|nr:PqqD family protein [Gemmatimonadales bacterium]